MRLVTSIAWMIIMTISIAANAQKKKASKETAETKPTETQVPATTPEQQVNDTTDPVLEHYYKKYAMASRWNDTQVAKSALYDMIIRRPENDSLIFTLAYMYFDGRQYAPAMLVSQELLARDSKNLAYLELSAASFEALGILDRSLQNYETLYLLSNNTMALYKIAFLQYDLKRYEEGLTNVDILLKKPDAETIKIGFNDTNSKPKDFSMKYAVLNLKGMLLQGKGDKAGAKKVYEDIIKQVPDFQPAVANLAELNKG
ncbi:MAG: tetratricopeptide repeat protein [Cyclobacteriaceae bacterium]